MNQNIKILNSKKSNRKEEIQISRYRNKWSSKGAKFGHMVKASTLPSQDLSELMTCVDKFWISCFNFCQHKVNLWIKFQNMNVTTIREALYLPSAAIFFVTLHPLLITLYKSDSFRFSPDFSAYISNNFEPFSDFLNRVKPIYIRINCLNKLTNTHL